jgi:hypothetical protein
MFWSDDVHFLNGAFFLVPILIGPHRWYISHRCGPHLPKKNPPISIFYTHAFVYKHTYLHINICICTVRGISFWSTHGCKFWSPHLRGKIGWEEGDSAHYLWLIESNFFVSFLFLVLRQLSPPQQASRLTQMGKVAPWASLRTYSLRFWQSWP